MMGALLPVCWLAVLAVIVVARPNTQTQTHERDSRAQTVLDGSNPEEKARSIPVSPSEEFKGGIVPVALLYDGSEDVSRPLRETKEVGGKVNDETEHKSQEQDGKPVEEEHKNLNASKHQEVRGINKNSKLLDIEARETDENSKYGLNIQSRNKVPSEEQEDLDKPFVYNIQPLSFYSSQTKEEENILNYINKIKEMKENKLQIEAAQKPQESNVHEKTEDAVVTETEADASDEENRPITRRIQHYETVIKPMIPDPQQYQQFQQYQAFQQYPGIPQGYPVYPASTMGLYPQQNQQPYPAFYQTPQSSQSVVYLPNPFVSKNSKKQTTKSGNDRLFDDYFPILINNPFNEIWAGITNIVEYGPSADVCKKSKKSRDVDDDDDVTEIDFSTRKIGSSPGSSSTSETSSPSPKDTFFPRFAKLKVRKGGVAIAGPGGIATAGSGGTAIVGPGGTAYTTGILIAALTVVASATPYYYPQQRQLFYPVPQYSQYPQYYQRQVYYAPHSAANLVSPVPAVRYPVGAPPAKSVVYYGAPALAPYPSNLVYGADEGAEEGSYFGTFLENFTSHLPAIWPGFGNEAESGSAAEGGSSPAASPEKIEQASNSEKPAKEGEEKEKENEAEKPQDPSKVQKVKGAVKGVPQKYVVLGQPQFFGNFGLQRVNPAAVLPTANQGAVSSYLLRNYPGPQYRLGPQFPVYPQPPQFAQAPVIPQGPQTAQAPQAADNPEAELIPAGQPGAAALGYQKLLKEAAAEAARQSKEYDDASVSVEAASQDSQDDKPEANSDDSEDKNEEETGTSD
ncbi:uncharacterized protein LOC128987286 isoform X2 [Macrosteles quadrilineatus]|uniref:uncharacterized protein LOC128987286 isoform X2 n=1 Tax=Macrosteles quadrilineatus TaxID=74068 RepID=UPI0023E0CC4E|nr:uncharacterized protein LOC128987286 isoform X2 [Macrosteles quadrilineatus]